MKSWGKYQKYFVEFIGNFLCLLVFWGGMLRQSFNADTIFHMVVDDADIRTNIEAGRYIISLCDYILFKLGIRVTDNQSITTFLALVMFALAMICIQHIFKQWIPEKPIHRAGYYIGTNLVFLNVLFSELLMFGECCFYFGLGYLMAAAAVYLFTKRKYVGMVIALAFAVCTYQYTMIFAAVLIAFYLCLSYEGELSPKAVWHEIIGVMACISMGVCNLLSIKLLERSGLIQEFGKHEGFGDIKVKLQLAIDSFIGLNESSADILPGLWFPLLFTLMLMVLIVYSCIKEHKPGRILYIVMVLLGGNLILYVIPLVQEEFSFPSRMSFCFYLVQGMLAVTAYAFCNIRVKDLLTGGCICYLAIQLLFSNFVVTNHFVSNTLDEVHINMFYQEILKYEDETGNRVSKIAYRNDACAPHYYEEVEYTSYEINERVLSQATNSLIKVITGRDFENLEMTEEEFRKYFEEYEDKDWEYLDLSEQLVIDGDTAYWCLF